MIRKQMNRYNPNNDPENWTNRAFQEDKMSDREGMKQIGLLESWRNIARSGDKSKIEEYELARRISSSTENDNQATRTQQRIEDFKIENIVAGKMKLNQGQSEQEFQEELDAYGNRYKKAVKGAIREVEQNG